MKIRYLIILLIFSFAAGCTFEGNTEPETVTIGAPANPNPPNNSINQETALTLSWQSEELLTFDVYLDINNPPASRIVKDTSAKNITVSGLVYDTDYYWKVIGTNAKGIRLESSVWHFTTHARVLPAEGYVMKLYSIETSAPSYVNVLYQVQDIYLQGVTNLTKSDFIVYENDQLISSSESAVQIIKREQTSYIYKVVLMLDNSTSLSPNLAQLRTAAASFVSKVLAIGQIQIAIYKFSEEPELLIDFTDNELALVSAIQSLGIGMNTTNLYGAVVTGASRWTDSYSLDGSVEGSLVLFTDGSDTQGSHTLDQALAALFDKRCYTIGLGNDIEPEILQQIGNSGFYSTNTVTNLTSKFLEVEISLGKISNSFYQLRYLSPKRGNFDHNLKLFIRDNQYQGSQSYITGTFNSADFYSISPGLYLNSSASNPAGVTSVSIAKGASLVLVAESFLATNLPFYSWTSGNTSIATVTADLLDNSRATLKAVGNSGQSTSVVVIDFNNELSKILTVIIQ